MTPKQHRRDQARGRTFWYGLSQNERFVIGDDLVLGTLDHLDWFGKPESSAFVNAIEYERLLWESIP